MSQRALLMAPLFAWLTPLAAGAASAASAEERPALRVLVPFDGREVSALQAAWNSHAADWGADAHVLRILTPTRRDVAGDTLLLGYEFGLLQTMERDGLLLASPRPFARESWAPVWSVAPAAAPAICRSFRELAEGAFMGRVWLRRPTLESPEGLLLGAVAAELRLDEETWLKGLVLASDDNSTLQPAGRSLRELLRRLPPGMVTLAPVRAAVAAQGEGALVDWGRPAEGFVAFELAAAVSREASGAARAWFDARFEPVLAAGVVAALDLEPLGPLPTGALPWQQRVVAAPLAFDRAAAEALRTRLVRLYGTEERGDTRSAIDLVEWLIDGALLTAALLFVWAVARKMGRGNDRDPRDGAVV